MEAQLEPKICKNPNATWGRGVKPDFVQPILNPADIDRIKAILKPKPRDLLLFTMGTELNIYVKDLVSLTIGQVRNKKPGDLIEIRNEGKKPKRYMITQSIHLVSLKWMKHLTDKPDDYPLFCSHKSDMALTTIRLHKVVKRWCYLINLQGNYGAQTMRKTWFQMQYLSGVPKKSLERLLKQDSKLEDYLGWSKNSSNLCDAQRGSGNAITCHLYQTPVNELLPLFL